MSGAREPYVSVTQFGATGTGTIDDIDALDAAVAFASDFGGTVLFPPGNYRITRPWKIGLSRWNSYNEFIERTRALNGPEIDALENTANQAVNYAAIGVSLKATGAVNIIADFTAATNYDAVVEYNTARNGGSASISGPFRVIPQELFDGVRYQRDNNFVPTGKLIGWAFNGTALKSVNGISASGMPVGVCCIGMFWSSMENMSFEYCTDCLHLTAANAMRVSNIDFWNSDRGLIFDGAATYLGEIHTQQIKEDIIIFDADCCDLAHCYLEDFSNDDGTGLYSVSLGQGQDEGPKVICTQLRSLRVGGGRPGKRAYKLNGATFVTIIGCREFSGGVDADSDSFGVLINTDFADTPQLPANRFARI